MKNQLLQIANELQECIDVIHDEAITDLTKDKLFDLICIKAKIAQIASTSKILSFDELTEKQKEELQQQAKKVAKEEGIGIKEVYDSFKLFTFAVTADHLHFAVFHPISMPSLD